MYIKALVLGSSKGIGRSILDELKSLKINCESPSSLELDTSNLNNIEEYFNKRNL